MQMSTVTLYAFSVHNTNIKYVNNKKYTHIHAHKHTHTSNKYSSDSSSAIVPINRINNSLCDILRMLLATTYYISITTLALFLSTPIPLNPTLP